MADQLFKPGDVARELGVASNTLRVYSARFGPVLTATAARPVAGEGGGSGHRLYAARDIAVLRRARDLVGAGATYEEALDQLRGEYGVPAAVGRGGAGVAGAAGDLTAHLATLQQAVDAWRALVDERTRELAEVRARLAAVEQELTAERQARAAVAIARPAAVLRSGDSPSVQQIAGEPATRSAGRGRAEPELAVETPLRRPSSAAARQAAERRDERSERTGSWLSRILPREPEARDV